MTRGQQPRCRRCGQQIRFVKLTTGAQKPLPVDPAPDADGNVVATRRGDRLVGHVLHKGEDCPAGWQQFMPHHATCGRAPGRVATPKPLTLFDQLETETR